jgi:CheY-like chemotaxis protein
VPDLWLVSIDRNQLENAVLNLAVNARDAMPQGGKLTLQTTNVDRLPAAARSHDGHRPGQYVRLTVKDTGTGMTKEVIDKAFDPFFTTKGIGQGTGLGLSQVYGFVKQSGGQVEIESVPGNGTAISIFLPRLMDATDHVAAPPTLQTAIDVAPHGQTVLVVEDEDVVRAFSVETLREMGLDVIEASDGASALSLLDDHTDVRMLFADLGLPGGMDGRQLADEARRRRPDIKVLLTTGYTQNAVIHEGRLDAGVNLLAKPFTYEALAARVKEILVG